MNFPVTTLYASLLGVLLIMLSLLVSKNRREAKVNLGLGEDPDLQRAVRAHGNFIEYVPLALILLLLLELEISQLWLLHLLGAMLLLSRLMHAWGVSRYSGVNRGRTWGTALTWMMILSTSFLNLWHLT